MSDEPPRIPERLLSWSLPDPQYCEEILGDLREEYASKPDSLRKRVWYTLCAEHVRQLGGESPLYNLMEVK